jgi:hypothetical protein
MNAESYTRKIDVAVKPVAVFRALTEEVDKWWTTASDDVPRVGTRATSRFDKLYPRPALREPPSDGLADSPARSGDEYSLIRKHGIS